MGITFRENHDVNGFGDVLVANPRIVNRQIEFVIIADEIVIRVDREAHPFLELALPGLVTQGDVNLYLWERHDNGFLESFGDLLGFIGSLPLAVKVLVAFGKQQFIRSRCIHFDDVTAKLQVVYEVGFRAAPIGLTNQLLEGKAGLVVVARQAIVDAQGGFGEILVKLRPSHHRQQGKEDQKGFLHNATGYNFIPQK